MLKARVITALFLVAGLSIVLFASSPALVLLAFSLMAALAAWEWGGLMQQDELPRRLFGGFVFLVCVGLGFAADFSSPWIFAASAAFWLLLVPFWLYRRWTLPGNAGVAYLLGLLVILPTWAAMVRLQVASSWLLLAAMALVWVADIAAYFAGRAFGRHKLAPQISPGKTWEGVAGAVIGVVLYGIAIVFASPLAGHLTWSPILVGALLLVLTALSIVGDLFESLLKRHAKIKDSSQLLPGHGGVLDRIDSLTSTLPVVALLLVWQ